jgi:hypothetical protein
MVAGLEKAKPPQKVGKEAFSSKIAADFEDCLNNDLDVKSAFDSVYQTINKLCEIKQTSNDKAIKNVLSDLHKIDSVLQCIF